MKKILGGHEWLEYYYAQYALLLYVRAGGGIAVSLLIFRSNVAFVMLFFFQRIHVQIFNGVFFYNKINIFA